MYHTQLQKHFNQCLPQFLSFVVHVQGQASVWRRGLAVPRDVNEKLSSLHKCSSFSPSQASKSIMAAVQRQLRFGGNLICYSYRDLSV